MWYVYTDLYHSLVCINKVFNRSTRFPVTLQRFSRQDRYHFLYFNNTESNKRKLLFDISTTLNQRTEEGKLLFDISTDYRFRHQQLKILPGRVGASAETGKVGEREAE